jgi:hypothetical protein
VSTARRRSSNVLCAYDPTMPDPRHPTRGRFVAVMIAFANFVNANPTPIVLLAGVAAPAVGTFLVTLGQNRHGRGDWTALIGGVVVIFLGGMMLFIKERASMTVANLDLKGFDRFRITIKDALQPVAELIADMPAQTPANRKRSIPPVALQAVSALTILLRDVYRLRAAAYAITESGDMECVHYLGRGGRPRPFSKDTDRGRRALDFVARGGEPLFVPDVDKADNEDYKGSKSGYQTFISASIHTADWGYGMLTIDAPRAGTLVDTDKQLVGLVGNLLAIAFAIAEWEKIGA